MSELFGAHISGARQRSPFGELPFQLAQGLQRNLVGPLLGQLGFGGGPPGAQARRQRALAGATGPLAEFIRSIQGEAGQITPLAQQVGGVTAARGSEAFSTLQGQINQLLQNVLPEAMGATREALGGAEQFQRTAFGPSALDPFFQAATRRAIEPLRAEFAGRGLGDSGAALAAEQDVRSRLSEQFATQQLGLQAQAPGLLAGIAGQLGQLGTTGVTGAENLLSAIPGLTQALSAPFTLPMQAQSQLFSLLTGGLAPAQQLLAQTAPQFVPFGGKQGLFGFPTLTG